MIEVADHHKRVVDSLSTLIRAKMRSLAQEQYGPSGSGPDASDDSIKRLKRQVNSLIRMRTDFEILMTEALLGPDSEDIARIREYVSNLKPDDTVIQPLPQEDNRPL